MKVLVVDDSIIYRKVIRDALAEFSGVEVVGVAADGEAAIQRIDTLKPDLVTLDIEMPVLDGLGVLERLSDRPTMPTVIMLSSLTADGATATSRALRYGAFDFVLKPSDGSLDENRERLKESLRPIVSQLLSQTKTTPVRAAVGANPAASVNNASPVVSKGKPSRLPPRAVVIGISTGGPAALAKLLPQIPGSFPVPILIVQHMPALFTKSLAEQLDRTSQVSVFEGAEGQVCQAGSVYIAPGGKQMRIEDNGSKITIHVTEDAPVENCRPSVNYLFESAARQLGNRCLAAVLTGMGTDGVTAGKLLKAAGATILTQDEASCVVYGMPRAMVDAGLSDQAISLNEFPTVLLKACRPATISCN